MGPIYRDDKQARIICREMLYLNLMPAETITKRFDSIVKEVDRWTALTDNKLLKVFAMFVHRTWITSSVWPPQSWFMFMQHRRKNNNAGMILKKVKQLRNNFKFYYKIPIYTESASR
jgi:hypothetical protein